MASSCPLLVHAPAPVVLTALARREAASACAPQDDSMASETCLTFPMMAVTWLKAAIGPCITSRMAAKDFDKDVFCSAVAFVCRSYCFSLFTASETCAFISSFNSSVVAIRISPCQPRALLTLLLPLSFYFLRL